MSDNRFYQVIVDHEVIVEGDGQEFREFFQKIKNGKVLHVRKMRGWALEEECGKKLSEDVA